MSEKIQTVKSPLAPGIERLPPPRYTGSITVMIMLPSGTVITNPDQFESDESYIEDAES